MLVNACVSENPPRYLAQEDNPTKTRARAQNNFGTQFAYTGNM